MREFNLIKDAIKVFSLDLHGITVLTEAASGHFVWTPIIAALAGAEVFAFSKDSYYATYKEVKENTENLASQLSIKSKIQVIDQLSKEIIQSADILTNTGFLRPINKEKLKYCSNTAVISLMYEPWEYRESDIDLKYCKENNIIVVGTNESDDRLKTIYYLGVVVKKALFLNEIEVFKSNILILGYGKFANSIYDSLKLETEMIKIWNKKEDIKALKDFDAIIVADHQTSINYIGPNGLIDPKILKAENQDIKIIHISGEIDKNSILDSNIQLFPKKIAKGKYMSLTTGFVGPKPVIDLHSAGLKVGEIALKKNKLFSTEKNYKPFIIDENLVQEF
jgi:hypothetical protein